jgi:hypothetical protein
LRVSSPCVRVPTSCIPWARSSPAAWQERCSW